MDILSNVNLPLIIITVLVSMLTWKRPAAFSRMVFHAPSIVYSREWYRLFSYGFLHVSAGHLFVNMFILWMFGKEVEALYVYWFGIKGHLLYLFLYLSAVIMSVLYDLKKQKDNDDYRAVGASGAVSAVLYAYIFLQPTQRLFIWFVPIGIPAILFGIFYLIYSSYMSKQNVDKIGHSSHFWGSIYGFVFVIPFQWHLLMSFFNQIYTFFW